MHGYFALATVKAFGTIQNIEWKWKKRAWSEALQMLSIKISLIACRGLQIGACWSPLPRANRSNLAGAPGILGKLFLLTIWHHTHRGGGLSKILSAARGTVLNTHIGTQTCSPNKWLSTTKRSHSRHLELHSKGISIWTQQQCMHVNRQTIGPEPASPSLKREYQTRVLPIVLCCPREEWFLPLHRNSWEAASL